jgi:SPP1 gp7 family putative phage head morphogenesis protein
LSTNAGRWEFLSDDDKIREFENWLRSHLDLIFRDATAEELWRAFIEEGFRKGAGRAFDDVRRKQRLADSQDKMDFYAGTREQFLQSAFANRESVAKVKLLVSRAFTDLKGVTEDMAHRMRRTLTDGLVQGKGPIDIARDLDEDLEMGRGRAEMIARTEIVRAHAQGQLDAMEDLGVEEIGVAVEWQGTDDGSMCEACAAMEGVVLHIDEARGMIPAHPNCRCAFVPANVGEDKEDQKRSKREIDRSIRQATDIVPSFPGQDNRISKSRPQSILNQEADPLLQFSNFLRGIR